MITQQKNSILEGNHGKPILTDVFYKKDGQPKPIVIFCHGYKGLKDWGAWDLVAQHFASKGFFFVKFNFSHNGTTPEQPLDFTDMDTFGANNYSIELDDLQTVIDWVTADDFLYKNQVNDNISLIGHSRGGGIVTIKAAESTKISKVISWAGVSDYASRFPADDALENWKKDGVMYVINGRTKQEMPHYFQFYTNFKENEERLTISRSAASLKIPHLIIHGTTDPAVSHKEAEMLHQWSSRSALFLVPEADHVFGGCHPWEDPHMPQYLKTIVEKSIQFIKL